MRLHAHNKCPSSPMSNTVSGDTMTNHFRSTTAQMYDAIRITVTETAPSRWHENQQGWCTVDGNLLGLIVILTLWGWICTASSGSSPSRTLTFWNTQVTILNHMHWWSETHRWLFWTTCTDGLKHIGDCSEPHALMVWNTQVTVLYHMHWWSETHRWLFWTTCTDGLKHTGYCSEPHALMVWNIGDCSEPPALMVWNTQVTVLNMF